MGKSKPGGRTGRAEKYSKRQNAANWFIPAKEEKNGERNRNRNEKDLLKSKPLTHAPQKRRKNGKTRVKGEKLGINRTVGCWAPVLSCYGCSVPGDKPHKLCTGKKRSTEGKGWPPRGMGRGECEVKRQENLYGGKRLTLQGGKTEMDSRLFTEKENAHESCRPALSSGGQSHKRWQERTSQDRPGERNKA